MYYDGFIHGVAFFMFSYILYNLIMFVNGHIRYKSNLHKFPSTVKAKDLCEKHTWSEDPITLAVKDGNILFAPAADISQEQTTS